MPIVTSTPPAESTNAFSQALVRRLTPQVRAARAERKLGASAEPSASGPQGFCSRVFSVSVRDLRRAVPLQEAARLEGWRYWTSEGGQLLAAEVSHVADQHVHTRWTRNGFNRQFLDLFARLRGAEVVEDGEYEFRVLVVPGLYVLAAWLVDERTGRSLVIPLRPTDAVLVPETAYTAEEFVAALSVSALRRIMPDPA